MNNPNNNQMNAVETAHYYELLWKKYNTKLNYAELFRIHFILDSIAQFMPQKGLKILDLGCGRGWMSAFLFQYGTVTGVDFSPAGIEFANKTFGQFGKFLLADPNSATLGIPESEKFDLVICSEVIEHVVDQEALIKQISQFLTAKGWCILTTPNGLVWPAYKAGNEFISRVFKFQSGIQPVENWISPLNLRSLFEKSKFTIKRHEGQTFYRFGIPPFMSVGFLEAKIVDYMFRKLGWLRGYSKTILNCGLYQILTAQKEIG